jgi:hypothetical protein
MLRRLGLLLAFAALAAGATVAVAAPGDGNGNGPPQDIVVGSGKVTFPPELGGATDQYIVSAHSGPAGDDPRGQITLRSTAIEENENKADVTCMVVTGKRARVGGTFEHPFTYLGFRIVGVEVIIEDNGSPGHGTDEATSFVFIDRPRPPGFSPCNFDAETLPLDEGNYTVYDSVTGRIVE